MRTLTRWGWLAAWLMSAGAVAADQPAAAEDSVVAPKLVQQAEPQISDGANPQGWVLISRCIDKDGTAADPVVVDSSGVAKLERAARYVTRESKYAPATLGDAPIDSCDAHVMMQFQNDDGGQTATDAFAAVASKAEKLVEDGKYQDARHALDELESWNTDEGRRIAILRAEIARLEGDSAEQMRWLESVLDSPGDLATNVAIDLSRRLFALQVEAKQYGRALESFTRLEALPGVTLSAGERTAGDQLKALPGGDTAFGTPGNLDARFADDGQPPSWSAPLLRRDFAFADVVGAPERFDLRCDNKHYRSPFGTENQWKVPASWGNCWVVVFGPADASFKLVEFPPAAPAGS